MSIRVDPVLYLPQPKRQEAYSGRVIAGYQGGATASVTFDVYTGGTGPQGAGTINAVQTIPGLRGYASTRSPDVPRGAGGFYFLGYAEDLAPQPPYNAGYGYFSFQGVSDATVPSVPIEDTVLMGATPIAVAVHRAAVSEQVHLQDYSMTTINTHLTDATSLRDKARVVYPTKHIADSFGVTSDLVGVGIHLLVARALFTDKAKLTLAVQHALTEEVELRDFLDALLQVAREDGVELSDAPSAWLTIAEQLMDVFRASGQLGHTLNAHVAVAVALALRDSVFGAHGSFLAASVAMTDDLLATAEAIAEVLDSFSVTAQATGGAILYAFLADNAGFADLPGSYAAVLQALADGAQFGITLYTGQDTWNAWVMTPQTRAMRRYTEYPFNSYAQVGNALYGAGPGGIYAMEGGTDDGAAILAKLRTGLMDFNSRQLKRMDRAYLGYASDGTLRLRVCATSPTGDKVDYTYSLVQVPADATREQRVSIGRGTQSVYWQFELDNDLTGSDFELTDITVLPMVLSRRV